VVDQLERALTDADVKIPEAVNVSCAVALQHHQRGVCAAAGSGVNPPSTGAAPPPPVVRGALAIGDTACKGVEGSIPDVVVAIEQESMLSLSSLYMAVIVWMHSYSMALPAFLLISTVFVATCTNTLFISSDTLRLLAPRSCSSVSICTCRNRLETPPHVVVGGVSHAQEVAQELHKQLHKA
jgi:hypothetical protein